jgi:ribosomal protein L19
MNLLDVVKADHQNPNAANHPNFKSGDTVSVHSRIKEGEKSRIQIFKGTVISVKKKGKLLQELVLKEFFLSIHQMLKKLKLYNVVNQDVLNFIT